jgi:hypothetical protein
MPALDAHDASADITLDQLIDDARATAAALPRPRREPDARQVIDLRDRVVVVPDSTLALLDGFEPYGS